MQRILAQAR